MANYAIAYNPLSGNGRGKEEAENLSVLLKDHKLEYFDITEIGNINDFLEKLPSDTRFLLAGGDGTINRFVNTADEKYILSRPVYYYGTGTGNDFLFDLGIKKGSMPFVLNKYIINLPTVTINGNTSKFLNGIGYGIDGYCCEEGDKLRKIPGKKINYTAIAVKGLLFKYSSANATVVADGNTTTYKKVWLAPTMNGRFFGGG
ncbi:MAG: diacylglycerol kinase family protein, partial [Firmicutes bacterium]|nr:diacylglycerol kinase family protein [Bacillota bacterium]